MRIRNSVAIVVIIWMFGLVLNPSLAGDGLERRYVAPSLPGEQGKS